MTKTLDTTSPQYHLRHWRTEETQKAEETLDAFLYYLEYDYGRDYNKHPEQDKLTPEELSKVKGWITSYLGFDMEKVKEAELAALNAWKVAGDV